MTTSSPNIAVHDTRNPRYRRDRATSTAGAFLLMAVISLSIALGFLVVPGAEHFGVTTAQFLIWYTIYTLSSAAVFAVLGKLMTVIGVRVVVIWSGLLVSASFVGMALAPNILVFYILSCPLGIGWAGNTMLAANTLVTGWHLHEKRGTVLGLVAAGVGVGGFVWGLIFPPIIESFGFQGGLIALAIFVTLLSVAPGILLIRNPPRAEQGPTKPKTSRERRALRVGIGAVVALLTLAAFFLSLEGAFSQIQAAIYAASGIEPQLAGFFVSFYALCGMVAKPILGYLNDKLGIYSLFIALGVMLVIGLPGIALLRESGMWVFWVLLPVAALSLSVTTVVLPLIAVRAIGPDRFPIVFGTVMSGLWIGLAIAVPLWGLTFDSTSSYDIAMYCGAVAGLLGLTLAFFAIRRGRKALPKQQLGESQMDVEEAVELATDAFDSEPEAVTARATTN